MKKEAKKELKEEIEVNTIDEAIADIAAGKLVIAVDDAERENEGDFITAARNATPEIINFMATHGRGLICAPLDSKRCDELKLNMMVSNQENSSLFETPFTISVDLKGHGCTTGISAQDRAKTIQALIDSSTKPEDLRRPGHIFPLRAHNGGVLRRAGHTEASIDLARLAGFEPAGTLVEIMNPDGTMARMPDLIKLADKFSLKIITIRDLIRYRLANESLIERLVTVDMPTKYGHFHLIAYRQIDTGDIHIALVKGSWQEKEPVLVRVHSSCVTGDIFGSLRCDCGNQIEKAMQMIEQAGQGILLYMQQEGRGIGLINKLKAYLLQERGLDTVEANLHLGFKMDERDYGVGAQILRDLGIRRMRLISNNPAKRAGIMGYGLEIVEKVKLQIEPNRYNENYLKTKRDKMSHDLPE